MLEKKRKMSKQRPLPMLHLLHTGALMHKAAGLDWLPCLVDLEWMLTQMHSHPATHLLFEPSSVEAGPI
ncbi:MAG: hypothetical protein ACOYKZ_00210 [Chlamydiia bacterium]